MEYIKLKSGYIIPNTTGISGESIDLKNIPNIVNNQYIDGDIAIISTGGTISAYETTLQDGVNVIQLKNSNSEPAQYITQKLSNVLNTLNEKISFYNPYNILSQNVDLNKLDLLLDLIYKLQTKYKQIIILHGTDNLAFSSCFVFYNIKPSIPIIFVGSQKSPDRPGSEYLQLIEHAILLGKKQKKGVYVVTYAGANISNIIQPHLLIKLDTYSRESFIADKLFAKITNDKITFFSNDKSQNKYIGKIDSDKRKNVIVLTVFPDFDTNILSYFQNENYKIVLIGTGLGHLPERVVDYIKNNNIKIYLTTRCLTGQTSDEVYTTSRIQNIKLLKNNIESNYIKLILDKI